MADRAENNLIRQYLLKCTVTHNDATQDTEAENAEAESLSTLAEPSPSYTHVPSPELSVSNSTTLATAKVAHATSESLDKLDKHEASDRFLGEFYVDNLQYASGRYVKQLKPNCLKFFKLIILAHVVHREGPKYSCLKNNCFWFATTLFDLIILLFGTDMLPPTPEDEIRERRYLPHNLDMTGHWMSLKVTTSDPKEVSK